MFSVLLAYLAANPLHVTQFSVYNGMFSVVLAYHAANPLHVAQQFSAYNDMFSVVLAYLAATLVVPSPSTETE